MLIRYGLATVTCCILIAGAFAYASHARTTFLAEFRQSLREAKETGELPPELENVDLETVTPEGFDIEVTQSQMTRLLVGDVITGFWFIWVPLIIAICFGTAYFTVPRT